MNAANHRTCTLLQSERAELAKLLRFDDLRAAVLERLAYVEPAILELGGVVNRDGDPDAFVDLEPEAYGLLRAMVMRNGKSLRWALTRLVDGEEQATLSQMAMVSRRSGENGEGVTGQRAGKTGLRTQMAKGGNL